MSLFGCPTRRAKHAKGARDSGWLDNTFQTDNQSLSRLSVGGQRTRKVRILQTYKAQLSNELSVTKGEVVHLLHHARHWAFVFNSEGTKGYIPYAFCSAEEINNVADSSSAQDRQAAGRGDGHQGPNLAHNGSQRPVQPGLSDDKPTPQKTGANGQGDSGLEALDMADTYSLRSSLEPETGRRMGAGVNMADVLPFFKVPYGKSAVLFDFEAEDENDLSVGRGETVVILNQDDPGWVWVRTDDCREGFVPRMYICPCGCTSIHEQIVESLQANMHRQQEYQLRQQTRHHDTKIAKQNPTSHSQRSNQKIGTSNSLPGAYRGGAERDGRAPADGVTYKAAQSSRPFSDTDIDTRAGQNQISKASARANDENDNGQAGERAKKPGQLSTEQIKMVIQTDYRAQGKDDLTVHRGEWVFVTERSLQHAEDTEWLFVYSTSNKRSGYIPKNCASVLA